MVTLENVLLTNTESSKRVARITRLWYETILMGNKKTSDRFKLLSCYLIVIKTNTFILVVWSAKNVCMGRLIQGRAGELSCWEIVPQRRMFKKLNEHFVYSFMKWSATSKVKPPVFRFWLRGSKYSKSSYRIFLSDIRHFYKS